MVWILTGLIKRGSISFLFFPNFDVLIDIHGPHLVAGDHGASYPENFVDVDSTGVKASHAVIVGHTTLLRVAKGYILSPTLSLLWGAWISHGLVVMEITFREM